MDVVQMGTECDCAIPPVVHWQRQGKTEKEFTLWHHLLLSSPRLCPSVQL